MNKVILYGRTTSDIELRYTQSNKAYIQFTIACDNGKDENGNKKEADFVNCVAWERNAEVIAKFVKKGNRFLVLGTFKTDKYETDSGENRYRSYVLVREYEFIESKKSEFVSSKSDDLGNEKQINDNITPVENDPYAEFGQEYTLNSEELPF